jgi:signal peptidase I
MTIASSDSSPRSKPGPRRRIITWGLVALVVFMVAVLARAFVAQSYYVPSGSMEPTIAAGDRIVVDKLSYHLGPVQRGDIIVFARPPNERVDQVPDLVKRVIGLPGETVSGRDGRVDINGKPLHEPWPLKCRTTSPFPPVKVGPRQYFVMGDNRCPRGSYDSRYWGTVPAHLIVGRVSGVIWPVSHAKHL